MKAKSNELKEAIDMQMDIDLAYLQKSTGKVFLLPEDILDGVRENDMSSISSYYNDEILEDAKKILQNPNDFLSFPSQYDMDEYKIMERFCCSISDDEIRGLSFNAIRGQGAFRRLKDLICRVDLIDKWYKYRDGTIKQEIIWWCEAYDIAYECDFQQQLI